jgi:Flp pilus assembly protein TadG
MAAHRCQRQHRDRSGSQGGDVRRAATSSLIGRFSRFRHDESGSYLVVTGMVMPALVGVIAFGTEAGVWLVSHRSMQNAADSAALSAATAYYAQGNKTGIDVQAQAVAAGYGFVNGENNTTVTVNSPPSSGNNTEKPKAVEVIIRQPRSRSFSALWMSGPVDISARSVAIGVGGKGCVISLDKTASGATTSSGSAPVKLNGCSLYDNSSNGSALVVGGSSSITADSVNVVGGISGGAGISAKDGIYSGQDPIADPYADASYPSFSGCKQNNFSAQHTVTLDPGVYCGGMKLNAGAVVTLNPGIYYLDKGDLTVNGGATLSGTGVTLVFTSSNGRNYANATINGGATINLTAPSSGPTAGIVLFGDRLMTVNTSFKLAGGSSEAFTGAIYLPAAAVSFSGGAAANNGCTQIVANTISFDGNSNLAVKCDGVGTRPIGSALAKLVE